MSNIALIDADSLLWSAAHNRESMDDIADYLDMKIGVILADNECQHYKLFVGGYNNFRYHIRSDYKANRVGKELPVLFRETKQYVIDSLNAFVSNGLETDDTICATAKWVNDNGDNAIVCTVDKDYKVKPLTTYVWERHLRGKVFPAETFTVDAEQARYNMIKMLLTGDGGDNIKVCKGIGDKGADKILSGLSHYDMIRAVIMTYKSFYGSRWRYKLTEAYHLLNLIDDYNTINIPKEFEFTL